MRNLDQIKAAYECGEGSLRELAERFSVSLSTLKKRSAQDKWSQPVDRSQANGVCDLTAATQNGTAYPENGTTHQASGSKNGTAVLENGTAHQASGSKNGTAAPENGTAHQANGSKNGTAAPENGTAHQANGSKNGTAASENGTTATENGTAHDPTGSNNGTTPPPTPFPSVMPTDLLEAILLYRTLGLAAYPCLGPTEGPIRERGKRPRFSGWTQWTVGDLSDAIINRFFGPGAAKPSNIGNRIVPPLIAVDLDSKADAGDSVREWLANQPALAGAPRERTGNGAHLWFICRNLPRFTNKSGAPYDKPIFAQINALVHAELFHCGNLVLSPSVHACSTVYTWEQAGPPPEVTWAQLQEWFGFEDPDPRVSDDEERPRGRPKKEKPWWSRFQGDLSTLDLVALAQEAGIYGELRDADSRKHSVRCPWSSDHSDGGANWNARLTETVIYESSRGMPGFKCLHAHCSERGLQQLLEWADGAHPGIVDRQCTTARVWEEGQRAEDGARLRVLLPGVGRPDSVFAGEMGRIIGAKKAWFNFADNVVVVRESADSERIGRGIAIHPIKPTEAITEAECHAEIGCLIKDEAGDTVFAPKSMTEATGRVWLASRQLRIELPVIRRLLDVPVPVLHHGALVYPAPGYDPRFKTYLAPDAPELFTMSLDEARSLVLNEILGTAEAGGFCWKDEQARCHGIARLITPFCRGLMQWARTPLWIFEANRERCGKDYLAQVTFLTYLGRQVIFPPPSRDCDEELRKRITTALIACARHMHFANLKGHIRFPSLEAATDGSGVWQDRILGGNTEATLPNEAEFSFSANSGTTWEPDIEGRSRRIALYWAPEFINDRDFRHVDLHDYVLTHRAALLSAMAAFVAEWDRQGRPMGTTRFASFPKWAAIVGGVMQACGLGDPCLPQADKTAVTGDQTTESMKALFTLGADEFGDRYAKKQEVYDLVQKNQDSVFEWLDLNTRAGQTTLGKALCKFAGRELNGIHLTMPPTGKNNLQFRFQRLASKSASAPQPGTSGTSGTFSRPSYSETKKSDDEKQGEKEGGDFTGCTDSSRTDVPDVPYVPCLTIHRGDLERIAEEIAISDAPVALDIETYSEGGKGGGALNPFDPCGQIRLLALCLPTREPWLLDLRALNYDLGPLKGVLETAAVVGHNLKFDLLWLRVKCGLIIRKAFCTMTASRLLTAGSQEPNDLGAVIYRHLGIKLPKDQARSDWGGMLLTKEQLAYSANDVRHLHALRSKLDAVIDEADLRQVADLEMELLPVVVTMEHSGFPVDRGQFDRIASTAMEQANLTANQIKATFKNPALNVASPIQLKEAFQKIGIEVADTGVQTLSGIDHETARLVLEYRAHEKLAQQATSLLEAVSKDGRIHARFEPTGTDTGRFSSRDPNVQNIGRGELRTAFAAPPGFSLVVADYSQIELRAAAAIAGDAAMLDAYRKGEDLHRRTAALILGKPETEVTKGDRQTAKAVGFGLLYGQSAAGLVKYAKASYGVAMSEAEARQFRERFFVSYRGLATWHKNAWRAAGEIGSMPACEVRTQAGRRRLLPRGGDDWTRFTGLVNTSVQGTCADGLKLAMVRLAGQLPADVQIIATVHDELVLIAPKAVAERVRELVVSTMIEAMGDLLPEVPIEVEAKLCSHWGEK